MSVLEYYFKNEVEEFLLWISGLRTWSEDLRILIKVTKSGLLSMRMRVQFLGSLCVLKDLVAIAVIRPLAWEPPHATGGALKDKTMKSGVRNNLIDVKNTETWDVILYLKEFRVLASFIHSTNIYWALTAC